MAGIGGKRPVRFRRRPFLSRRSFSQCGAAAKYPNFGRSPPNSQIPKPAVSNAPEWIVSDHRQGKMLNMSICGFTNRFI